MVTARARPVRYAWRYGSPSVRDRAGRQSGARVVARGTAADVGVRRRPRRGVREAAAHLWTRGTSGSDGRTGVAGSRLPRGAGGTAERECLAARRAVLAGPARGNCRGTGRCSPATRCGRRCSWTATSTWPPGTPIMRRCGRSRTGALRRGGSAGDRRPVRRRAGGDARGRDGDGGVRRSGGAVHAAIAADGHHEAVRVPCRTRGRAGHGPVADARRWAGRRAGDRAGARRHDAARRAPAGPARGRPDVVHAARRSRTVGRAVGA